MHDLGRRPQGADADEHGEQEEDARRLGAVVGEEEQPQSPDRKAREQRQENGHFRSLQPPLVPACRTALSPRAAAPTLPAWTPRPGPSAAWADWPATSHGRPRVR